MNNIIMLAGITAILAVTISFAFAAETTGTATATVVDLSNCTLKDREVICQ